MRLWATVFLFTSLSFAEPVKVLVVPFGRSNTQADAPMKKFALQLAEGLRERPDRLQLVSMPPLQEPQEVRDAANLMAQAKKAATDGKHEEAVNLYRKSISLMMSNAVSAEMSRIEESLVAMAELALRLGDEALAHSALQELARLNPQFAVPMGFPPIFLREFEKAKRKLEKVARGSVLIEGPQGATVYLDGRDVGAAPARVDSVIYGTHLVRIEGTSQERGGITLELKASKMSVSVAYMPGTIRNATIAPTLNPEAVESIANLARLSGASVVIIGYVSELSGSQWVLESALLSVRQKTFVRLGATPFDRAAATSKIDAWKLADEISRAVSLTQNGEPAPYMLSKMANGVPLSIRPREFATDDAMLTPKGRGVAVPTSVVETEAKEAKKVPVWVWIVGSVAVATGAALGTYFIVKEVQRPATGTVVATW